MSVPKFFFRRIKIIWSLKKKKTNSRSKPDEEHISLKNMEIDKGIMSDERDSYDRYVLLNWIRFDFLYILIWILFS